jgi:hypothetical protein
MEYLEEVLEIMLKYGASNTMGDYYLNIPDYGTLTMSSITEKYQLLLFDGANFTQFDELSDEVQSAIYCYLYDNRFTLRDLGQECLVEVDSADDLNWVVAPSNIFGNAPEEGQPPIIIGSVGVAREIRVGEEELRTVVFVSPDGTWTTLTCYTGNDEVETQTAKNDMQAIGQEIINFIEKL